MFNGKSILITGGTGSFGKYFIQHVLEKYTPQRLIIFSRDELKQFEMSSMKHLQNIPCLRYFLGDVRDLSRLQLAFRGVDYVIHAAALKHVPAAEYNPTECIKTNIDGAMNVTRAAMDLNVKKVIALSTDKAASPINLYGATKLVSDKLFTAANNLSGKNGCRFSVVRYGNVVNSRGSIIPYFKHLLAEKTDFLPITHADMTRFCITLDQGIRFVIRSFERMHGGEIFVPKIPSMRIIDLARALAPGIKQTIIGLRPGEKIHAIMCPGDSAHLTLEFSDHYVIEPTTELKNSNYSQNNCQERGERVPDNFEYNSSQNTHFLTLDELQTYIHESQIESFHPPL